MTWKKVLLMSAGQAIALSMPFAIWVSLIWAKDFRRTLKKRWRRN